MPKYVDVGMLKIEISKAYPRFLRCFLNPAFRALENMPSANVKPVNHGVWEPMFNNPYVLFNRDTAKVSGISCSCCGAVFNVELEIGYALKYNYCPRCGARMDTNA